MSQYAKLIVELLYEVRSDGDVIAGPTGLERRAARAISALEEALRPFAEYLDTAKFDLDHKGEPLPDDEGMGWVYLTVGDFRRARTALASTP